MKDGKQASVAEPCWQVHTGPSHTGSHSLLISLAGKYTTEIGKHVCATYRMGSKHSSLRNRSAASHLPLVALVRKGSSPLPTLTPSSQSLHIH